MKTHGQTVTGSCIRFGAMLAAEVPLFAVSGISTSALAHFCPKMDSSGPCFGPTRDLRFRSQMPCRSVRVPEHQSAGASECRSIRVLGHRSAVASDCGASVQEMPYFWTDGGLNRTKSAKMHTVSPFFATFLD